MAEPDVMVYPDSGKVGIFGVRAVVGMFADGPSMGDPYPPWASFSAPQVFSTGFPIVEPVRGSPTVLARATRQHHLDVQIRRAESSVRGPGVQSTGTRGTKYGDPGYKVRGPGVQSTGTRGTKYGDPGYKVRNYFRNPGFAGVFGGFAKRPTFLTDLLYSVAKGFETMGMRSLGRRLNWIQL
jgi:hypothetical protein